MGEMGIFIGASVCRLTRNAFRTLSLSLSLSLYLSASQIDLSF